MCNVLIGTSEFFLCSLRSLKYLPQIAQEIMLSLFNNLHVKKHHKRPRQMKFWQHAVLNCNLHSCKCMKNALISNYQKWIIFSCNMLLGLKSFTCFQNQNSVHCEFVFKITSMILDQIAWYEVQLVLYYIHSEIAEFSCSNTWF